LIGFTSRMESMRMDSTSTNRRRFTLLDGMILVAATACGCAVDAWINSLGHVQDTDVMQVFASWLQERRYGELTLVVLIMVMPVLAAWTLVLVPLRLIAPRPSRRILASQPGWMACCAFAVALAFAATMIGGFLAIKGIIDASMLVELIPMLPLSIAPAILTAWMSLVLGRRWRPEPSWLDRSGRALAVFWVLMGIAGPILILTFL
jgi:hypothetical protein